MKRLNQQVNEAAVIGDSDYFNHGGSQDDIPEYAVIAVELTVIGTSDLPKQIVFPIADISTESFLVGNMRFYRNILSYNPRSAVLYYDNILDSILIGRSCMTEMQEFMWD